jgi:hypothetical protein
MIPLPLSRQWNTRKVGRATLVRRLALMPADERKTFLLRIDPALWREIESWAQDELRSVNGQIEYLLREAVRRLKGVAVQTASRSRQQAR